MVAFVANLDMHSPPMQWAVILAILAMISFTVVRPAMKRKKDPLAKSPVASGLVRERNVERQMQNLLVELSEMARQITAQLDTRSAKLQALIAEADEKIAVLSAMPGASPRADFDSFKPDPSPSSPAAPAVPVPAEGPAAADTRYRQIYILADDGQSASEIAAALDRPRGEIELILALRSRG